MNSEGESLGQAIREHWLLFSVLVIALFGAGVALGLTRSPDYSAQATGAVGLNAVRPRAVPGYVEATTLLASTYSEAIDSPAVVDPVASKMGLSSADVRDSISASAIPTENVVDVQATSSDSAEAVDLANNAADALGAYSVQLSSGGHGTGGLAQNATGGPAASLQTISPATSASSDRTSRLALYAIAGLAAGLLLGAAFALIREHR